MKRVHMPISPTVRGRRLAAELRRLRDTAGLTIEEVAQRLEISASKVSRMETGRRSIHPRDVRDLLDVYEVTGEQREIMLTLARQSRQKGWWHTYGEAIPEWFEVYVGLESEATSLRTYQTQLVPGLLQTEAYQRAFLRTDPQGTEDQKTDRKVALRMARQERLTNDDPPKLWAVLDEAVIHRVVGDTMIMRQQLEHLIQTAALPHVLLQVLPFAAGAHSAMDGAFMLLGFPEPIDPDVVYLEGQTGGLYLEKPHEIERYTMSFDHLCATALGPEQSVALIQQVIQELA
jgi:transcriptional regulator with XRE-family HTH domain